MILDPTVRVECNECEYFVEYHLTPLARGAWDARALEKSLEIDGWKTVGDDDHLCEDCTRDD